MVAQNILVFQKLTRVMAKLTDDVEADLQRRIEAWELVAHQTDDRLSRAASTADLIWERLKGIDDLLEHRVGSSLSQTAAAMEDGTRSAETLQQLLALTIKTALEGNSQLAFAHEEALESFNSQASKDLNGFASRMRAAVETAIALHDTLVSHPPYQFIPSSILTSQNNVYYQADSLAAHQEQLEQVREDASITSTRRD